MTQSATRVRIRTGDWSWIRRRPAVLAGSALLGLLVLLALLAPVLSPYPEGAEVGPPFTPPSSEFLLGTDDSGADVLTGLLWGGRASLLVGFCAAAIALFIGGAIGLIGGYRGGRVDKALTALTNYFLVIPDLVLAIVVAALWGPSLFHIIIVIGGLSWTATARLVRSEVRSVRERGYVRRSRALGASGFYTVRMHVLPHIGPLVIAAAVLNVANAVFAEAALSFLGLGDPETTSWGKLIANAFSRAATSNGAWWAILTPGVMIMLTVGACVLLGRGIEEAQRPRRRATAGAAGATPADPAPVLEPMGG